MRREPMNLSAAEVEELRREGYDFEPIEPERRAKGGPKQLVRISRRGYRLEPDQAVVVGGLGAPQAKAA